MHIVFGEQLRAARKKQGLTVREVAARCKTSRSYITLIETNKRRPGKKILLKLAQALKVNSTVVLNWYLEDLRYRLTSAE